MALTGRDIDRHGHRVNYTYGCRCNDCTAANTRYMRDYRNGLRGDRHNRQGDYRIQTRPPSR